MSFIDLFLSWFGDFEKELCKQKTVFPVFLLSVIEWNKFWGLLQSVAYAAL